MPEIVESAEAPLERRPEAQGSRAARLLRFAGPLDGMHALVIGAAPTSLLDALLGSDCAAATCLRDTRLLAEDGQDLLIAPDLDEIAAALRVVRLARRALAPTGRLVASVHGAPSDMLGAALLREIGREGLVAVRTRLLAGSFLLRADLPFFGEAASAVRIRHAA